MFPTVIRPICRYNAILDLIKVADDIIVYYLKIPASTLRAFLVGHSSIVFIAVTL